MKRTAFFLTLCFFLTHTALGQSRYCNSYSEFMNDQWSEVDTVYMRNISNVVQSKYGGSAFKPITPNKPLRKVLKKKARFLIHHDSLFINCKGLTYGNLKFTKGYTHGFRCGDKIGFTTVNIEKKDQTRLLVSGLFLGAIGSSLVMQTLLKKQVCYLISSDEPELTILTAADMEELLQPYPELLEEYRAVEEEQKAKAITVQEFLKRAELIKKY